MLEYQKFVDNQERIYQRFRDTSKIEAEGTKPSPAIQGQGGYIIAFRHPSSITDSLAGFSEHLARSVGGAITYDADNAHTSFGTYGITEDFSPDNDVLKTLAEGLFKARDSVRSPPIHFSSCLYSQDTVIVSGGPAYDPELALSRRAFELYFVRAFNEIASECRSLGCELKEPSMAHMTALRFNRETKPEQLQGFFRLMLGGHNFRALGISYPVGMTYPEFLDVGHFTLNPEEFKFNTYERFKL